MMRAAFALAAGLVGAITLAMAAPPAHGADVYEAWAVDRFDNMVLASTANESGSQFGLLCSRTCIWYVDLGKTCKAGETYPAMLNSEAGAKAIELRCLGIRPGPRKSDLMKIDGDLAETILHGGIVGFAVPLASGQFSVSRFPLRGAYKAAARAILIWKAMTRDKQDGLRDFTI